jgi:hypothetical protein
MQLRKRTTKITKSLLSWKDKYKNLQMFDNTSPEEETYIYELIEREISYIFSTEASIKNNPTSYRYISPYVNRVLLLYIIYPSFLLENNAHSRVSYLHRYTDYIDYVLRCIKHENIPNTDVDRYRFSITQDIALAKKRIRHCNRLLQSYIKDYKFFLHLVLFRYCSLFDIRNNILSFLLP